MFRLFKVKARQAGRPLAFRAGKRQFASGAVYAKAMERNQALVATYPGIFDNNKFTKEQNALIEASWANNPALVSKWNEKAVDMQERGIRFFYEIGGEKSIEAHPQYQPAPKMPTKPEPLTNPDRDWACMEKRFGAGEELIGKLDWMKEEVQGQIDHSNEDAAVKRKLRLMEASEVMENFEGWLSKLETEADEWKGVAIPCNEAEYGNFIYTWKKECEFVGNPDHGSSKSILINWEKLSAEESKALKAHVQLREETFLKDFIQKRDPSVQADRWFKWRDTLEDLWKPKDMEHYRWCEYSKDLFRAALWQGAERIPVVEKAYGQLFEIIKSHSASEADILRETFQDYPDIKFRAEASQWLQAQDPLCVAKLLNTIRERVEDSTFQRAVRDCAKPYIDNVHAATKWGITKGLDKYEPGEEKRLAAESKMLCGADTSQYWSEAREYRRLMGEFQEEEKEFNKAPITVAEVAEELVGKWCWQLPDDPRAAQIEAFKQKVIAYCEGKNSRKENLQALDAEFWKLMPHNVEKFDDRQGVGPSDHNHIYYFCKLQETTQKNPKYWSLGMLLERDEWELSCDSPFSEEGYRRNSQLVNKILEKYNMDPIIMNLLKVLIQDSAMAELEDIYKDYRECVQKFQGEIHGTVTSAQPLEEAQFTTIMDSLKKSNPGKKFFLSQQVDASLLGGFVVKCGMQTLDFSLVREVDAMKAASKSG